MSQHKKVPVITIDGPSGTGKGTICHLLAEHLNWNILDSGVIYRVLAFAAVKEQVSLDDIQGLVDLAKHLDLQFKIESGSKQRVILQGEDISSDIRSEACGQNASTIAAIGPVREALLERQRAFAVAPGLVTDGRDMGTIVFPDAQLKIFLYASEEERAKRRYLELKSKGNNVSLAQVIEELVKRDARDTKRAHAPLKPAEDAVMIDTTGLNITQVFDNVVQLVNKHIV